jgi:hypothetical protein
MERLANGYDQVIRVDKDTGEVEEELAHHALASHAGVF